MTIPPDPASGVPTPPLRRASAILAIAALVVVGGVVYRTWFAGDAARATGAASPCFYDGRHRTDCPTPRTGPHADTAWVWAGVIDTLYVRAPGMVGPASLVALAERTVSAPLRDDADASRVAAALTTAAPALPPATAAVLVTRLRDVSAEPAALLVPLFTVGERQRRYDSATAARVATGRATDKNEALPPRGLLALSRPVFDDARTWALVYAQRSLAPVRTDDAPTVERTYVLLSRLPDGRWRAVRIVPA